MIEILERKNLPNVTTISDYLTPELARENPHLQRKFDLIVASSVCAFLPNYEETLTVLKGLLSPKGIFMQWDWLLTTDNPTFGFTVEQVQETLEKVGFVRVSVTEAFSLGCDGSEGVGHVIMGVGYQQ